MRYSKHARVRKQQRGITSKLAEFVRTHGECEYSRGQLVFRYVRNGKTKNIHIPPPLRDKLRKSPYIVVGRDGKVVTVGWHYKRRKENFRPHYENPRRKRGHRH